MLCGIIISLDFSHGSTCSHHGRPLKVRAADAQTHGTRHLPGPYRVTRLCSLSLGCSVNGEKRNPFINLYSWARKMASPVSFVFDYFRSENRLLGRHPVCWAMPVGGSPWEQVLTSSFGLLKKNSSNKQRPPPTHHKKHFRLLHSEQVQFPDPNFLWLPRGDLRVNQDSLEVTLGLIHWTLGKTWILAWLLPDCISSTHILECSRVLISEVCPRVDLCL